MTRFRPNPPASFAALSDFKKHCKYELPQEYFRFLQDANGGEGFVGQNRYVILWPIEELLKMNEDYQVGEYAPGVFIFGSDGGGEAYGFDLRFDQKPVVSVPFVGMDLTLVQFLARDIEEFLDEAPI